MTTHVKLGAKKDGTLTAMQIRVVSNTGAYGNHGGETLAASLGCPIAAYRCPNKKGDGYAVYTNTVPAGGFRGYGASQTTFAIECAIDELARKLGIDPFAIRRKNMIRADDRIESDLEDPSDVDVRQLRLDQCLDLVETALASGRGRKQARRRRMAGGTGVALAMLECGPPTEHRSGAEMALAGRRHLSPGRGLRGDGQRLGNLASPDRRLGARHAAPSASPSSTPTRTERPTTPAHSPAPAPSSPAKPSR